MDDISFGNVAPLKPEEVVHMIPDFVIAAVNKLLQEHWDGNQAIIKQDDIMAIISSNDENDERPSKQEIYDRHWLDFEKIYREAGWNVLYDRPAIDENFKPYFKFTKNL